MPSDRTLTREAGVTLPAAFITIKEKKMKQKWLALGAIAVIAIVGMFVFDFATSAQRPERGERGERGRRGGRDMMGGMMNPTSIVDNSWTDLTFILKVDDETLVKARPIYQDTRDKFQAEFKKVQASGDRRQMMQSMMAIAGKVGSEFQTALKEVLSEEQLMKLNALTKKRQTEQAERMNRWGGGGGNRRGGGGGTR